MPQLNKGGKFVFGWSVISSSGKVVFPDMVLDEYKLSNEDYLFIVTGSKISGGFCVFNKKQLMQSKLNSIFELNPKLLNRVTEPGEFITFKGRKYCWVNFYEGSYIILDDLTLKNLDLKLYDKLLIIRGSNIAFDCIVKGPLVEMANESEIPIEKF